MNEGALATLDDNAVIERIASGEIMMNIAAEYGVRKQSLRERLLKHPRYHQAIRDQADSIVETATKECMECDADMPVIARARLRLEAAHKWAAARYPEVWGNRPSVQVNLSVGLDNGAVCSISDLLNRVAQQQTNTNCSIIEHEKE